MTFREQNRTLMQFGGTLSLLKAKTTDDEKLERILAAWEPDILDFMVYWLSVCYDRDTVPFEPIPYKTGGAVFKEDPLTTPMDLVDMLDGGLNKEEAEAILEDMAKHMYRPAYETFRDILARNLSKYHMDEALARKLMGALV